MKPLCFFLQGRTTVREGYVDSWLLLSFFLENWWETCAQTVCTHAFDAFVTVLAPAFTVYRDVFLMKHYNVNPLFSKWKDFTLPLHAFCTVRSERIKTFGYPVTLGRRDGLSPLRCEENDPTFGKSWEKIEGILQKMEHIQIHHNQMLKKKNCFLAAYCFFLKILLWLVSLSPSTLLMSLPPKKKHVQWILRPQEEASWILSRS